MSTEGPAPGAPEKDTFPTLTAAQIERLAPLGRERPFAAGEILFEAGGTNRPLMVVLEGEIEILADRDTLVTVHYPGNFSRRRRCDRRTSRRRPGASAAARAASSRYPRCAFAASF